MDRLGQEGFRKVLNVNNVEIGSVVWVLLDILNRH